VRKDLKLDYAWDKGGFGSIMQGDFKVHNNSAYSIKDIEITCEHFSKSDTNIDSNDRVIYEVVESKSNKVFNDFNMGFIHSQVDSTNCSITDFEVIEI